MRLKCHKFVHMLLLSQHQVCVYIFLVFGSCQYLCYTLYLLNRVESVIVVISCSSAVNLYDAFKKKVISPCLQHSGVRLVLESTVAHSRDVISLSVTRHRVWVERDGECDCQRFVFSRYVLRPLSQFTMATGRDNLLFERTVRTIYRLKKT